MMHLTEFQTFLLLSVLKVVVVVVITLMAVAYTVLLERKVLGRIQNRWGPPGSAPSACCSRSPTASSSSSRKTSCPSRLNALFLSSLPSSR